MAKNAQVKPNSKGSERITDEAEVPDLHAVVGPGDQPEFAGQTVPGAVEKKTRKRLSSDSKAEMVARLAAGESTADIAKHYGVSYATVAVLKRGGSSVSQAAKPSSGDSDLKRRLLAFAVSSLLTPDAVDAAERDALTKLLQDDLAKKIEAVKVQYMLSL
jgi:transposase-like protein